QAERFIREREVLAQQVAALRDENSRLNGAPSELLKLRGEAATLRSQSQESARLKALAANKNDTALEVAMKSWLARVKELRRRSEQTAGAMIPEMGYLTDTDWLDAAR